MAEPARWLIATAATDYLPESGFRDLQLPELAGEVERMVDLFGRLGYRRVPGFGLNLGFRQFGDRLGEFVTHPDRREDDLVVVYYTGHGVLDRGDLLLPMADTTDRLAQTAVFAEDLAGRWLRGSPVRRLLYILDTCHAAAGGTTITAQLQGFVNNVKASNIEASAAVLVSARVREQAEPGAFTQAFVAAVDCPATGGHEPDFLPLDELVGVVNDRTPGHQHAQLVTLVEGVSEFIPNPRVDHTLRDLDLCAQRRRRVETIGRATFREHIAPRAHGLDALTPDTEDRWLFTGRHHALATISGWLRDPTSGSLVVIGGPGSGKSAVLARVHLLADPHLRQRVPDLEALPLATLPPDAAIAGFVHARGKTAEEVFAEIRLACGVRDESITRPGHLLQALRGQGDPVVVVVDALDEAIDAAEHQPSAVQGEYPVVEQVMAPLMAAAHRTRLRLLVGTRRHLLRPLDIVDGCGQATGLSTLVDLDEGTFTNRGDLRGYAMRILVDLVESSPYRHQPRRYLAEVADALARAAQTSYLVALITARSLALRPEPVADPTDPVWRASLPRYADQAMRSDLDDRLGVHAAKARDLLMPLAYAHGTGLPWADIWPMLATRLTINGARYTSSDIDWLIDHAGFYILEATTEDRGRSVYRLYHEALAEHLRGTRADPAADQAIVVEALTKQVPRRADGHPDWFRAHPYTKASLATHAVGTPCLDVLACDPRFLLAARPAPLLAALRHTTTREAHVAADAYRRAEPRLRTHPEPHRPAYLQLTARCGRAPALAEAIATSGLPLAWTTDWASWRLQPPHQTFTGHTRGVRSVALGRVEGRDVIVSGGDDATVWVWDAATGTPVGEPFTGHTGMVLSVALGRVEGRDVIVSGGQD
ncbi:MAG: caspase family protein, partial [Micromonosporaceae bacterium]|nr:caspase family protein [Micromonosporaceae bacterium]